MKELILDEIKKNNHITFKNLLSKFNIGHEELHKLLLEMKLDGVILQLGSNYRVFPDDLYLGNVTVSSSGRKYIMHNNEKIQIASDFLNGIILNDTVSYRLNQDNEAEIYTVVNRSLGRMTCEVKVVNGKKLIIPFHNDIQVKLDDTIVDSLYDGDIIVININPEDTNDISYIGTIGRRDDPLIDDVTIALNYGFDNIYDSLYMKEVYALPTEVSEDETVGREDYRSQDSFTIDGRYTKDMDDGVYGEMLPSGNIRIYVHIADVSHYIKIGSKIFERACEKTTSLYMNNSVFHMLHHIISNGICSLNELKDRLTKTVIMEIDTDGNIVNYDIVRSVINSKKKMTYEDVDEIIMNNNMVPGYEKFEKSLYILYDAAVRLEKRYTQNGKVAFANTETNKTYNSDGTINNVADPVNSISRKIIENLMVAANETVANWFVNLDIPTVYRVHEIPDINKINAVIAKLNKDGYKIKPIKEVDNPKALQVLLNILAGYQEYPIISTMLVMAMQRARYSTNNLGHYALGLPAYLHFTSPIRRLADLLVHHLIDLVLDNPEKLTPEYLAELEDWLEDLCKQASRMERQAEMAERIAERRQILKLLNKDDIYEATVLEIGRKIKLRLEGVETYVDSKELDSILGYNTKRKRYYDTETGTHLKIGSKLLVRVTSIDSVNDNFNVKIIDMVKEEVKTKTKKKQ